MKYTILINQFAAVNSGLDLDLIDLCIFDFIKDFANSQACIKMQTPEGIYFWISHKLIIEAMPLLNIKTPQGLIKRIDNLIRAELINKHPNCEIYSKTLYQFGSNYDLLTFAPKSEKRIKTEFQPLNESLEGVKPELTAPLNESLGDNIIKDSIINDNQEMAQNEFSASLFPEPEIGKSEKEKEKKTLFRNSEVYKMVEFDEKGGGDYSKFEACFNTPEFAPVDLVYYFHCVADWSDQKNMKRTKNGWLATVRNFIRGDVERKKLHLKTEHQAPQNRINVAGAMEYLKDDY